MINLADSVVYSYSAYMLTSLGTEECNACLISLIPELGISIAFSPGTTVSGPISMCSIPPSYNELKKNSATFERGFYRSIIPGAVAVAVGLLLDIAVVILYYGVLRESHI
jgi:hypothetical protein